MLLLAAKRGLHLYPTRMIGMTVMLHLLVVSYFHMVLDRGLLLDTALSPDGGGGAAPFAPSAAPWSAPEDDGCGDAHDGRDATVATLTSFPQLLADNYSNALWIHLQARRRRLEFRSLLPFKTTITVRAQPTMTAHASVSQSERNRRRAAPITVRAQPATMMCLHHLDHIQSATDDDGARLRRRSGSRSCSRRRTQAACCSRSRASSG